MKNYLNKTKSLDERKQIYKNEVTDKRMNPMPKEKFKVSKHDPESVGAEEEELAKRERELPLKKLKTYGLKPKVIREGQMIGMYESKQDLYLTFAHRCNEMQAEINNLKKQIVKLKK